MNIIMSPDHHHPIYYSLPLSHHSLMSPYYFPLSLHPSCPFIPCSHPIMPLHSQPSLPSYPFFASPSYPFFPHHLSSPHHPSTIPCHPHWVMIFCHLNQTTKTIPFDSKLFQDIQIKTSYKSMSHLEMSLGTSFQP
jgi:hypothetical protein